MPYVSVVKSPDPETGEFIHQKGCSIKEKGRDERKEAGDAQTYNAGERRTLATHLQLKSVKHRKRGAHSL
jgi:hypothetical protein